MDIQVLAQQFTVCKVSDLKEIDIQSPFTFTGCTDEEISVVCASEKVPTDVLQREDGWRAFRITGILDFALIGILARITAVLAEAQIGVFVVSTYNTDYVLVKGEKLDLAIKKLQSNGYNVRFAE